MPQGTHGDRRYLGKYGTDYYYPGFVNGVQGNTIYKYYASKGIRLVRFSFRWERFQNHFYDPLNTTEMQRVDASIAEAGKLGMKVILDVHNYGKYIAQDQTIYWIGGGPTGSGYKPLPVPAYEDFMRKLAQHFKNNPTIYAYGLMNEPVYDNGIWDTQVAQKGINAIRYNTDGTVNDWTHIIHVPGNTWDTIYNWRINNANLNVTDPANKFAYDGHVYFNPVVSNNYGYLTPYPKIYPNPTYPYTNPAQIPAAILSDWKAWLVSKGANGFISEFGFPDNDRGLDGFGPQGLTYNPEYSTISTASDYNAWLVVMDATLAYMKNNRIGGILWLADDGSSKDNENFEPRKVGPTQFIGRDKPMMTILQKYIPTSCVTSTHKACVIVACTNSVPSTCTYGCQLTSGSGTDQCSTSATCPTPHL